MPSAKTVSFLLNEVLVHYRCSIILKTTPPCIQGRTAYALYQYTKIRDKLDHPQTTCITLVNRFPLTIARYKPSGVKTDITPHDNDIIQRPPILMSATFSKWVHKDVVPPAFMRRPGSELDVPDRAAKQERLLSPTEACKRLLAELGRREDLNYYELITRDYSQGISEAALEALMNTLEGMDDLSILSLAK